MMAANKNDSNWEYEAYGKRSCGNKNSCNFEKYLLTQLTMMLTMVLIINVTMKCFL